MKRHAGAVRSQTAHGMARVFYPPRYAGTETVTVPKNAIPREVRLTKQTAIAPACVGLTARVPLPYLAKFTATVSLLAAAPVESVVRRLLRSASPANA